MQAEQFPTHIDIAVRQLTHALDLYMNGGDLICTITLGGAAEEILGKLAKEKTGTNSVERRATQTNELYNFIFPKAGKVPDGTFITMKNDIRNMMKHKKEPPISGEIDFNRHAGLIIKRAIENYEIVVGIKTKGMRAFEAERLKRSKNTNASE